MLWGLSGDPPFDSVRRELVRRDVPLLVLDQRIGQHLRFDLSTSDAMAGQLTLDDDAIDIDDIGAIYLRPYDPCQVLEESSGTPPDAGAREAALALQYQLFVWTEMADALVINRPSAMESNGSKPYQAELIRRSGFEIPPTLVTTTPDVAAEFIARHEQVIYKSVSAARSMVSRLGESELDGLGDVVNCPTQFQAYIAGTDWRVHVVGDDVYGCEIHCAADDYRCAGLQGVAIDMRSSVLPESVAARCHALAHALNLSVAGIDLRRTPDDAWYCFEVNPAPAFTYYEEMTGQPLSAAVARLLSNAGNDTRTRLDA